MAEYRNSPSLDGLVELGTRDGVDIQPTLLRVTTDLYVAKAHHSAEEEHHYTELALRLIDVVDSPTRAAVAKRLSSYSAAPAAVMQRLARYNIPAAGIEAPSPDPSPVPIPVATVTGSTAANELAEIFHAASAVERRLILLNLDFATFAPAEPIDRPVAAEAIRRLETAALAHNTEAFAQEIERTLDIARTQARRLIGDPSGEPIVVLAIAIGMPASVLQRILLCLNPAIAQSVQRVYELATLYEDVEPQAALRLLAIWQATYKQKRAAATKPVAPPPLPPAPHLPHYWHVEPRTRSTPAAHAPRPAPAVPAARSAPLASDAPAAPGVRPKIRWDELLKKADSA